ncbi:MAG TPA: helical backbone metal receptor [Aquabacterium sp.]|uniref:ABC transporter substrate-binding protein n=1 Tax=Aquabacterium sp. TaxID=1872578 RepID=UPI002E375AE0|nr:helical backbone metal receptor [Aquabacterium sp.]HEX5373515.1 helical backbone metal receptor [Aquabacterium sp.]
MTAARVWALWWWMCLGVWAGVGGVAHAGPVRLVDDRGGVVTLSRPPVRIVSLLPSLTETVCDLGACERIVATDRWSNWPERVRGLPKLGGLDDPNVEMIVAQRPDLVLVAPASRLAQRLRGLGLTVAEFDARDVHEMQRVMAHVAILLGQPERAAQRWTALQAEIASAKTLLGGRGSGARVYFEVSSTPFAAGESSFIGQLLTQLGARNVVPASLGPFPKLNPEFVVKADPDLIMVSAQDAASLAQRPGWAGMSALRHRRVCALSPVQVDVLARPGPRLGQAARVLAQCLSLVERER